MYKTYEIVSTHGATHSNDFYRETCSKSAEFL